jgi:capsule polysaccharide export protein KpsC/LpsZ
MQYINTVTLLLLANTVSLYISYERKLNPVTEKKRFLLKARSDFTTCLQNKKYRGLLLYILGRLSENFWQHAGIVQYENMWRCAGIGRCCSAAP